MSFICGDGNAIQILPIGGSGDGVGEPRGVKEVMAAANVSGTPATPKGLRHSFGVNAFQSNVPPHLVQRWLGHSIWARLDSSFATGGESDLLCWLDQRRPDQPVCANEHIRKHARAAYDLAAHLREAAACTEATTSIVNLIAITAGLRDPMSSE